MATLKQSLDWAKQNPTDSRTDELIKRLQSGSFDDQARQEGLDLSSISPTFKQGGESAQPQGFFGAMSKGFQQGQDALNAPAFTGEQLQGAKSPLGFGGMETANIGKSLVKNVAGMAEAPISGAMNIAKLPASITGAIKDLTGAAGSAAKASQMSAQAKEQTGKTTSGGAWGETAQAAGQVINPVLNKPALTQGVQSLISPALQKLFGGDVKGAASSEAEDPYQLLPYFLGAKELMERTPLGGTKFGQTVDAGMKAPTQAIKTGAGVIGEAAGIAKKAVTSEPVKSFVSKGTPFEKILSPTPEMKMSRLDDAIQQGIDKGVKPTVYGKKDMTTRQKFYDKANLAVKTVAERRSDIQVKDAEGNPTGKAPQSAAQGADAIAQAEKSIYAEYSKMAKDSGDMGAKFKATPAVQKLTEYANDISNTPSARKFAQGLIPEIKELEGKDPTTVEKRIEEYNGELKGFYAGTVKPIEAQIKASVARVMREGLDDTIMNAAGEGYSVLKKQYGALKALEPEMNKRAIVLARQAAKGMPDLTDIFTGGELISGLVTGNLGAVAKGATGMGIKALYKELNKPDRYIKSMFTQAYNTIPEPVTTTVPPAEGTTAPGKSMMPMTPKTPASSFREAAPKTASLLDKIRNTPAGLSIKDVSKEQPPIFSGLKDLSTKLVEKLKGRSTVSRQFISDLTNSPDLKQTEKDIVRNVLDAQKGDSIPVADFAKKVAEAIKKSKKVFPLKNPNK